MSYMSFNFRLFFVEFIPLKHSNFSAHVSGVTAAAAAAAPAVAAEAEAVGEDVGQPVSRPGEQAASGPQKAARFRPRCVPPRSVRVRLGEYAPLTPPTGGVRGRGGDGLGRGWGLWKYQSPILFALR